MKAPLRKVLSTLGRSLRHTRLARSPLLNRLQAQLSRRLADSDVAEMGRFRFRLDPRDQVIAKKLLLYNEFEKAEIELLCAMVGPGDVVLDVGANIGIHTVFLSDAVGPSGQVIAVEPDPDNLRLLRQNVSINSCINVRILDCAFGDCWADRELYQSHTNRGNLSLIGDLANTGQSRTVPVRRGDEALAGLGVAPRLAKIDVEGYEYPVLKGLGNRKPSLIMMEFIPAYVERSGIDPMDFLAWLAEEGYAVRLFDPHTETLRSITAPELIRHSRSSGRESTVVLTKAAAPEPFRSSPAWPAADRG
jgi:FkbM family methyltransferase